MHQGHESRSRSVPSKKKKRSRSRSDSSSSDSNSSDSNSSRSSNDSESVSRSRSRKRKNQKEKVTKKKKHQKKKKKSKHSSSSSSSRSLSPEDQKKKREKKDSSNNKKTPFKKEIIKRRSTSPDPLSDEAKRFACTLYVGNFTSEMTFTASVLKKFFDSEMEKVSGRSNPQKSAVREVRVQSAMLRAFVEFRTPTDAELALALDGILYMGRALRVRWPKAAELREVSAVPAQSEDAIDKIFLGGLPLHLSQEAIIDVCRQFGELSGFTLMQDRITGHFKDFAFLSYKDPAASTRAIAALDRSELGGRTIICRLARRDNVESIGAFTREEPLENVNNLRLGASSQALMRARMNGLLGVANRPDKRVDLRGIGMYADRERAQVSSAMLLRPPQQQQLPQQVPQPKPQPLQRTCVIMLLNMVTSKELTSWQEYADVYADIKTECQKYGKLVTLLIPRISRSQPPPDSERRLIEKDLGKVFVEYSSLADAGKAFNALSGRAFAYRIITASYLLEKEWNRVLSVHKKEKA